jgi:hypothetical protein
VAVLVWALIRQARPSSPRPALAAWAAAAVTAAQPTSANPAQPALAFALGAVLLAARRRPAWAGAAAAAAAFWRPDIGACAALAAAATLALPARGKGVRGAGVCVGVAALGVGVLYAPFLVAAGPRAVWDGLVVQSAGDGAWWRLPFPPGVREGLTVYAALAIALLALWRPPRGVRAGLALLALGATAYYASRADAEHAQVLLVVACGLAALVRPRIAGAVALALLIAVGGAHRASALLRPPDLAPLHVAGAGGVEVPPTDATALPRVVALVDRLVPPGQPIYVAPRRSDLVTFSNPLLHFLVRRPNVLRRDVLLQAKPAEQRTIVAVLERTRPRAVIRWTDPASSKPEPNLRGRPSGSKALDAYLGRAYRLRARYGYYDVLVPRY